MEPSCVIEELEEEPVVVQQQQQAPAAPPSPPPLPNNQQQQPAASVSPAAGRSGGGGDVAAAAAAPSSSSPSPPEPGQPQQRQEAASSASTAAAAAAGGEEAGGGSDDAAAAALAPPAPAAAGDAAAAAEQEEQEEQAAAPPSASTSGAGDEGDEGGDEGGRDEATAALVARCEEIKARANARYADGDVDGALALYWEAIDLAPEDAPERAVYCCNAAACYLKQGQWQLAAEQCSAALRLDEGYLKALVRRSIALERLDDLERALADARRVAELDPRNAWASEATRRLQPLVEQRQEKLKEEMLGKLKDLGNTLLGKFGLSLDNFKAEQDPSSGGYSIKFVQQGGGGGEGEAAAGEG